MQRHTFARRPGSKAFVPSACAWSKTYTGGLLLRVQIPVKAFSISIVPQTRSSVAPRGRSTMLIGIFTFTKSSLFEGIANSKRLKWTKPIENNQFAFSRSSTKPRGLPFAIRLEHFRRHQIWICGAAHEWIILDNIDQRKQVNLKVLLAFRKKNVTPK